MRIEATIPDGRRDQLETLQAELGLSKSQVVDEALALFLHAYLEAKKGRRLAIIESESGKQISEVTSPSLGHVEWTNYRQSLKLSAAAVEKIRQMVKKPAAPTAALRKAFARARRAGKQRSA